MFYAKFRAVHSGLGMCTLSGIPDCLKDAVGEDGSRRLENKPGKDIKEKKIKQKLTLAENLQRWYWASYNVILTTKLEDRFHPILQVRKLRRREVLWCLAHSLPSQ